ncbi:MAG: GNAT family protein [Pseudomonadota bacterium]
MKQSVPANAHNALGQEIGYPVPDWSQRALPDGSSLSGQHVRLERLDAARHGDDLWAAFDAEPDEADWTYAATDKPATGATLDALITGHAASVDPQFYAIIDLVSGRAVGWATFMRMDPDNGVIEVGNIRYGRQLQQTRGGTEAMALMMAHAFDTLGYRRYEWKCHAQNMPSRRAAARYGFRYEGTHRQAMVVKGRNRDTAWFSILDTEWPLIKHAFATWLDDANFDAAGEQRRSLTDIRDAIRLDF